MFERGLVVILFMYALSFSLLGVQYMLADVLGVQMTSMSGEPIRPNVLARTNIDRLAALSSDVQDTDPGTIQVSPILAAAEIAYDLFQIMTGTYIFTLLLVLDIPPIFVTGIVVLYTILMIRSIIAYLRGV